jgi:hypothetical protein
VSGTIRIDALMIVQRWSMTDRDAPGGDEQERNKAVRVALIDVPGSGILAERKPDEPLLVLRQKTEEEKAKSGSSVMEGIGTSACPASLCAISSLLVSHVVSAQGVRCCMPTWRRRSWTTCCTPMKMQRPLKWLTTCSARKAFSSVGRVVCRVSCVVCRVVPTYAFFLGSSGALNCVAAYLLAKKLGPGHCVVTFLCDSGSRYESKIYNPAWLKEKNITIGPAEDLSFLRHIEELNGIPPA